MDGLEALVKLINSYLWGKWLVYVLLSLGILYTISNGFIQIRHFGFIIRRTLIDSFKTRHEDKGSGSISTFKAMMVTLAGNVGGGNVVGVATAIVSGGMGAVFWMWVAAFFGMALKYGEIVLSQMYRGKDKEGNLLSGPMYYIRDGLKCPWLGIVIAVLMCTKMMGANLVQSNTISGILNANYGVPTYVTGIILIVLLMCITLGGLKRLANLAMNLVPSMSIFYIVIGVLVILLNIQAVPHVIAEIFTQAWSFDSVAGGTGGYVIAQAMQYGIARGMYSNEAGEGTAPFAHGCSIVPHPVDEGITGVTEVFVDTIVICSCTAFVMLLAPESVTGGRQGMDLLQAAMQYHLGSFGVVFIAVTLALFSFSTFIGILYYARCNVAYLFGDSWFWQTAYKVLALVMLVVGGMQAYTVVWDLGDVGIGLMTIFNMLALYPLSGEALTALREYETKKKLK